MIPSIFKRIFGSKNDRMIKEYAKRIKEINALEEIYQKLSDDEIKAKFDELKRAVQNKETTLEQVLNDSFAITREVSKRVLNMRHFDVQMIGGLVLYEGKIAEMKTGFLTNA